MCYVYLCSSPRVNAVKVGKWYKPLQEYLQFAKSLYNDDDLQVIMYECKDVEEVEEVESGFKRHFERNLVGCGDLYDKNEELEKQYNDYLRARTRTSKVLYGPLEKI